MFRCPEDVDVQQTRYGMLSLLTLNDGSIAHCTGVQKIGPYSCKM